MCLFGWLSQTKEILSKASLPFERSSGDDDLSSVWVFRTGRASDWCAPQEALYKYAIQSVLQIRQSSFWQVKIPEEDYCGCTSGSSIARSDSEQLYYLYLHGPIMSYMLHWLSVSISQRISRCCFVM